MINRSTSSGSARSGSNASHSVSSSTNSSGDGNNNSNSRRSSMGSKLGTKLKNKVKFHKRKSGSGSASTSTTTTIKTIEIQQSFDNVSIIEEETVVHDNNDVSTTEDHAVNNNAKQVEGGKIDESSSSINEDIEREDDIADKNSESITPTLYNNKSADTNNTGVSTDAEDNNDNNNNKNNNKERDSLNESNDSGYRKFLDIVNESSKTMNNDLGDDGKEVAQDDEHVYKACDDADYGAEEDQDNREDADKDSHDNVVGNNTDKDKLESLDADEVVEPSKIANECTEKMNLDDAELRDNGQAIETVDEDIDEVDKCDWADGDNESLKDDLESLCDNEDPAQQSASFSPSELPQLANEDAENSLDGLPMDKEDDQNECKNKADKGELESVHDAAESNPQSFTPSQPSQPLTSKTSKESTPSPTTCSGSDCLGQFSSVSGPSPVRLNAGGRKFINLDVSMDSHPSPTYKSPTFQEQQLISSKDPIKDKPVAAEKKKDGKDAVDDKKQSPPLLFRPDIFTKMQHPPTTSSRETTPSSELSTQPATVSATDCMSQFSSLKSPSPMKMNHFNFDVDMSMDSTNVGVDDSVLDDVNISSCTDDVDPDDDVMNNDVIDEEHSDNSDDSQKQGQTRPCRSPRESFDYVSANKQSKLSHPSSTRSSRLRNQTSNVSTPSTSMLQQEYNVDHSCSTPLERLARDIGNTLRQWHVHQGCDWHVPLDWAEKMEDIEEELDDEESQSDEVLNDDDEYEKEIEEDEVVEDDVSILGTMDNESQTTTDVSAPEAPSRMSFDLCARSFVSRTRTVSSWMGDEKSQIPNGINLNKSKPQPQSQPPPQPLQPSISKSKPRLSPPNKSVLPKIAVQKVVREHGHRGARCIRSQKIQFQTMGYSSEKDEDSITWNRRRYNIPLVLKLWDAPYFPSDVKSDETKNDGGSDEKVDFIPKSLQPGISPSSYSLLGELGILSQCGTERPFYKQSDRSMGSLHTGLTQDISTLFNIGQHITLCLDLSEITGANDAELLYNDIRSYTENHINEAIEAQSQSLQERRRRLKDQHKKMAKRKMIRLRQQKKQNGEFEGSEEESTSSGDEHNYTSLVGVGSQSMSFDDDEQVVFDDGSIHDDGQEVGSEYDGGESNSSDDADSESYSDDLLENDLHLNQQEIHAEVTASLTTMLQTALNLSASQNNCSLPVFGIWGDYKGDLNRKGDAEKSWMPSGLERDLLQIGDGFFQVRQGGSEEEHIMSKILLSSPALSGMCQSGIFRSSHHLYFIPQQVLPLHLSTLNGLANVLIAQCHSNNVALTAARHCYHWEQQGQGENQGWRTSDNVGIAQAVEVYREKCRQQALLILKRASSSSIYKPVPIWGPSEGNPLVSVSASIAWGVITSENDNNAKPPPLLALPLKIRSSNFASSPSELLDMEHALQSAALNPLGLGVVEKEHGSHEFGPREPIFLASVKFDSDAPCATLSANTRCVLAALLRCGSLGLDVLAGHLTKKDTLANFSRQATAQVAGESTSGEDLIDTDKILHKAMDFAKVGPVTKRLVDALDWGDIETDLSSADFDRALTETLRIQTYPAPPAEVFSITEMKNKVHIPSGQHRSPCKGSPPGRLLSVLFDHMARLRTPPSMMRLWLSFVEELRTRWDHNESLPNLGFVPGLDDTGDQDDQPHWGLKKTDTRVLGHKADHAAFVNSSEPDPDRDHCLINQKLQVYNICIECKMSTEALHERMYNDQHDDSMDSGGSASEKHSSSSDDDEFFDPEEEEVSFDASPEKQHGSHRNIERMLMLQAAVSNPSHSLRSGARCPVPDALPLIESGDQLYAPYLQRTLPMTDEEEQKQKQFLGVSKNIVEEERPSIKSRIAIAQRLQKPKLLSDMSAFKAANHGAVFEDFVRWYGNPENPLSEEISGETARKASEYRSRLPPDQARTLALEEASEAIAILMSLRAFWEDSWEEAEEAAAFDQEPLFDSYATVEMILHSFETIHPALLMNQVLAVKLTNAKFVLESDAHPAMKIRSVSHGLKKLNDAVDVALGSLTNDVSICQLAPKKSTDKDPLVYVSTSTIANCEEACNVIGQFEILLSRALSLLQFFPGQYDLVDILLQCKDEQFIFMKCPRERSAFLSGIKHQQQMITPKTLHEASPAMREYVLSNLDSSNPCQLSARLVPNLEEAQSASLFNESLLMAITKSCHK